MKKEPKATSSLHHHHSQQDDFNNYVSNNKIEEINPKKMKENSDLHQKIQNEIKEYEAKIKFERDQRMNLVEKKKAEIDKKEKTLHLMKSTNQRLQADLESLQVEVEAKLDQVEYKEKHYQYKYEKEQKEDPLKQIAKVKEKELNNSMQLIENYKKEKDMYELKLKEKIDLFQVNLLNDQIKMANEKVKDLEREVVFLQKIKNEHQSCLQTKEKLESDINLMKQKIQLLKLQNKEQKKANSIEIHKPDSGIRRKSQERIEREMKHNLDDFWSKNDQLIINNYEESNITGLPYNDSKRRMKTNITSTTNKNKSKNLLKLKNIFPPIIGLFNSEEKQVLSNILPLQEIEKYEKRYENLDITKTNIERKFAMETKLLNKENKELEDKNVIANLKLKDNEQKNQTLREHIQEQQVELCNLKVKLSGLVKQLENTKSKAKEKEQMNKNLAQELQLIQKEYNDNNNQGL